MGSKNSWRLQFIDIDSSFTINTEASTIKGYMVVRAPKGETNPYYFEKGNQEAIYAMIGVPTSNWPDLYEAEAFNKEYGLYISAPAGSSASYPSYFGGSYITSKGLIDFYNVTGKSLVDYTQMVQVGFESAQGYGNSKVNIIVNPEGVGGDSGYNRGAIPDGTKDNIAIYITGITAKVWANVKEIGLNYWGDEKSGFEEGTYYYSVNKTDHKLYVEDSDGNIVTDFYCGVWWKADDSSYSVMIGGNSWVINNSSFKTGQTPALNTLKELGITATSTNSSSNSDAPLLTLTNLLPNVELACAMSTYNWANVVSYLEKGNTYTDPSSDINTDFLDAEIIVDIDGNKTIYTTPSTYVSPKDRYQGITWLLDIKADTYGYIIQKSPTETTTEVSISSIGYDKWKYDFAAPLIIGDLKKIDRSVLDKLNYNNDDNLFLNIEGYYPGNELTVPEKSAAAKKIKLYSYNPDLDETKYPTAAKASANVGESYLTQSILIYGVKVLKSNNSGVVNSLSENTTTLQIDHEIVYVESASSFQFEAEDDANYPLVKDINFNTMTFSVKEEVYPGEKMSGGEFTGSFDEKGKDGFGANIYWPNVLNDDDMSFIEIHPDKTFDEDLDSHGIYTKKRIVDDKLTYDVDGNTVPTSYSLNLKGQRYATYVANKNVADGTTGGAWRDEFQSIVKQGWTEAFDAQYDDVYVFMDPTGQEFVHTLQASLVDNTHKLAMAISPKLITQAEFANPSKLTVTGRSKQAAQYAGEFQYYDAYTGKSFWMMPIGDVGLMYCRIIERKMGGWAPAWYNYNNMGGQLPRAILKARWNFSDTATKIMDEKGINPIVYNADDGLMCVSSKTTQDPNNVTDWSEVGHVLAFLLCKREIRDNVMRQQIKKPIDDYWMAVRQEQVEAILAKRTVGSNKIWAKAVCDIAGVNTDVTKAARKFIIYVKVKVNVFSEYVVLTFENVGQTVNI